MYFISRSTPLLSRDCTPFSMSLALKELSTLSTSPSARSYTKKAITSLYTSSWKGLVQKPVMNTCHETWCRMMLANPELSEKHIQCERTLMSEWYSANSLHVASQTSCQTRLTLTFWFLVLIGGFFSTACSASMRFPLQTGVKGKEKDHLTRCKFYCKTFTVFQSRKDEWRVVQNMK